MVQKASEYGVDTDQLYNSLEEMLAKADIDVVDIVTGPETHLPFVKLAAAAGKQIMCQKPFAPSLKEAEEIVGTAREAGVRLMVTENWRWLQPIQAIKSVLESGSLGTLNVVRYINSDFFTPRMSPERAIAQPFLTSMPKLMFYEMGAHWFDTWRFLFGEPKRLFAETGSFSPYVVGEDAGVITLSHGHFYGLMDMCWVTRRELTASLDQVENGRAVDAHFKEQFIIDGNHASLIMYTDGTIVTMDSAGTRQLIAEKTELDYEESHYRLQTHFIHCLDTGEPFQTSGEDNLKTLSLAFATYESASEHKVIRFDKP